MQIKTTRRYHLIHVRMAIIKKTREKRMPARTWRKGNPHALVVGMQTGRVTMEDNMAVPQEIKNRTTT